MKKYIVGWYNLKKMEFLRGILGISRIDKVQNTEIRKQLYTTPLSEKIGEPKLRWFGHSNGQTPVTDTPLPVDADVKFPHDQHPLQTSTWQVVTNSKVLNVNLT
ncbi:hypothetical protein FQA39_LY09038 [Lamprigera yunnana]|nr:hypothetical protein FQA39_LY09038 [Lamprigera yunnana]